MWAGGALLLLLVAAAIAVTMALHRAEPYLRARIVAALEQHFHARVELDTFYVSVMNGLWVEGKGLRIWPSSTATLAASGAPLIRLAEFRFHAPLHYEPGKPFYVSLVQLEGLDIDVPPKVSFSRAT